MDEIATLRAATDRLVDAIRTDPAAAVGAYDGWTLVDLGRHVLQIHRWVTPIVATLHDDGPPQMPTVDTPAEELADALTAAGAELAATLESADPTASLWTFNRRDPTVGFWRLRMALETSLHAWDADDALGRPHAVTDEVARAGTGEALEVYVLARLRKAELGGGGKRVAFVPEGSTGWTVTLNDVGVELSDGAAGAHATVGGAPMEVWKLVTGRAPLDAFDVDGDLDAATLAVTAAASIPGPAG